MSKATFTILDCYSGNMDIVLSATKKLNDRLKEIYERNKMSGMPDPRPQPRDIYKSHNFFVASTFIPHVAVGYEYYKKSKEGGGMVRLINNNTQQIRFNLQGNEGDWITDQVVHIVFEAIGASNDSLSATRYQYCDYPGARLFKEVKLTMEETEVSSYTHLDSSMHEVRITEDKVLGYQRGLGQEEIKNGYYYFKDQRVTQHLAFSDGAQTPRTIQPALHLWIPLIFWYNLDQQQALNNSRVKTKQRNIDITLAPLNEIIRAVDENNNVINVIENHRIEKCDLYTRNIYTNAEVRDLYTERPHLAMIRTRRNHEEILTETTKDVLLSELKYPIEYICFGFMPMSNDLSFTDWYRFTTKNSTELPIPAIIYNPLCAPVQQLVVRTANYLSYEVPVLNVGFRVHGNQLYPLMPPAFYNQHIPRQSPNMTSFRDIGKLMVSFNLLTGMRELSGHFNNSVGREFYLQYSGGETISNLNPMRLYVMAMCLNFIYYDKNSFNLKYS